MSYVEPTAAVLISLPESTARSRGRDFLLSLQHTDGGWGIASIDSDSGWMTAWAVRALTELSADRNAIMRGANWLLANEGWRIEEANARAQNLALFKIDSTLRGWSWQPGDAAWVQPTALAMLALINAGYVDNNRVREGAQYLFDRAIPSGGWNIGNPWMLDKQIPATIQDTAIALLALRATKTESNDARVARAIDYLRSALDRAHTAAELAWGIYALRSWNLSVGDAVDRLKALQSEDGSWGHNPFITAIGILAIKT